MKLRIFTAVLLAALTAGFIWGAGQLQAMYDAESARYSDAADQLEQLDQQASEMQQKLDALTLDAANERSAQAAQLLAEAQALSDQITALQTQIGELNVYLEQNQAAIAEAEEQLNYLQGVYDALEQGLTEAKGYLGEN